MDCYLRTAQVVTLLTYADWNLKIIHIRRKSEKSLETFRMLGSTGEKVLSACFLFSLQT
jgi:hypothetical protein